jgi:hypothetical protein
MILYHTGVQRKPVAGGKRTFVGRKVEMTSLRFDSALVPPSVRWMLREEPLEAAWSMSMGVEDIVCVGVPLG